MDLHALLRRLQAGEGDRRIARALRLDRKTVAKYRAWATAERLLDGPLPDLAELHAQLAAAFAEAPPPQNRSSVEAYRDDIQTWLAQGKGPRTIYRLLCERGGFAASESAVWRLVNQLRPVKAPVAVGRLETPPGEVAQVDFGTVGELIDPATGKARRAQAFVLVLGFSRHMYAEFVFDQKLATWLTCHRHAFEFFKGVPARVVLDNLKSAIVQAATRERDAEVQRSYGECAEHYGFLIDPCWPRTPQHKGKVERGGVGYLKQSFWPLLPPDTPLPEANRRLHAWLMDVAGQREHGTTHVAPLQRFRETEQAALKPLPSTPFDPAVWKQVKLHRDGHVVFEKTFYSAPCRLVGQTLWLRAGLSEIRLFAEDFQLVATHPRATAPGERLTHPEHWPPGKAAGLCASRERCQAQADAIGPATAQVVAELLAERPLDKLRTALRVLHLAERYTPARLEAACVRGLAFGDASVLALRRILDAKLETASIEPARTPAGAFRFARPAHELADAIAGGTSWN